MSSFKVHESDLALPLGSLILVTGASGYIASHIVREALLAGYKVRGTARSEEKAARTRKVHGSENYTTVIVEDMADQKAFEEAVKGVDAVIHTTNVMSFGDSVEEVVEPSVKGVNSIMSAAIGEKSIKRFVYTSSSCACTVPKPEVKFRIDASTWNEEIEQKLEKERQKGNGFEVYALSKTKSERAIWDFVKNKKPSWITNCVLPNANMGEIIDTPGATGGIVLQVLEGKPIGMDPQYMINVQDDARLHLAAAIDKTVSNERILAFDEPFNSNDVAKAVEKVVGRKTLDQDPNEKHDRSEVDNARGAELLKKWWGQDGYQGLEETVRQNLKGKY